MRSRRQQLWPWLGPQNDPWIDANYEGRQCLLEEGLSNLLPIPKGNDISRFKSWFCFDRP
jgi:hypothetical protein